MPTATKREASEYRLPEGEYFPAVLKAVTEREIPYTIKRGPKAGEKATFKKWEWEFEITGGEFEGVGAYGDTEAELTTREDNLVRQWGETLLGRELELGEDFDTDLVLEIPCLISVRHDEPRKRSDGTNFYPCPVNEVFPLTGQDLTQATQDPWATNGTSTGFNDDPPF